MPEFDSGGVRLHYEVAGPAAGPPIVLVHGYASDYELNWVGSRWQDTLGGAGRRVVGLDLRGHGRSQKPHDPAVYNDEIMAADITRLLDHLAIERTDYLGYSMGSWIGLRLIVDHPQRVRRAVFGGIGDGRGFPGRRESIANRMRGDASVRDPVAEMFYQFAVARPGNDLEALAACIQGRTPGFAEADVAAIRTPILIVNGNVDSMALGGAEFAASIPSASFAELDNRNHMNAVPARRFKELTLEFLDS